VVGKSLTSFTFQLNIMNCQEKFETNLFDGYVYKGFFFFCFAAIYSLQSIVGTVLPLRICLSHVQASMPLLIVVMTSLMHLFRPSTSVTLVA
jgi:CBS domain containing-hemolysin-like protein